jgi:hypothetical protein
MMPSPDVRPYVDLTLFDESAQEIYLRALDYARTALPEYEPREGTIESVLLQAFAREVQEAIASINRLPGSMIEVLLRLLDIERNVGTRATSIVKFSGQTTTDFVVPGGTRLYYQASQDASPLLLETTSTITATYTKTISSISRSGTTVTVTTTTRHGLSPGDLITTTNTGVTALNLTNVAVQTVSADGFTFTVISSTSGTTSATVGTVTPAITIPASGFAPVQTTQLTGEFNGLPSGTVLRVLSVVPSIASAQLAQTLTGGATAETDLDYFSRATSTLGRLSAGLVTRGQIEQYVVDSGNFADVYRVTVADNTSGGRVSNLSSRVLVAVAPIDASETNLLTGVGTGAVTPTSASYGVLDEVYDGVNERIHSSLTVAVAHPALITVKVAATVSLPDGLFPADVEAACAATLETYLSPNTWPWSTAIRENELVVQLRNATVEVGTVTYPAIEYVSSVTITPTDFYVPSTSTYNRFTVTQRARSSNVATLTVGAAHGMTIGTNETLYIKVAEMSDSSFDTVPVGGFVVAATAASGSTFSYSNTGSNVTTVANASGFVMALAKYNSATRVLTLLDPAPLVISGTHVVTAQ